MFRNLRSVTPVVLLSALVATGCAARSGADVITVERVDLNRYAGQWFEVARFPNRFQDECVGDVTAAYALRSDGRVDVTNQCRTANGPIEARGEARVIDSASNAKLEVRFAPAWLSWLPFVWGDYWVLGLGSDYSWAVVGSPDREYLWILARTPGLDWEHFTLGLATASANGFDVQRLVRTTHGTDPR